MKKYFFLLAAMFIGSVCLTSCGDDDDVEDAIEDIASGKVKPTVTIKDGNPAVFTAVFKGVATQTMTATFDENDMCSKFITEETYATDKLADQAWKEIQEDCDEDELKYYTRKGKTITEDESEFYEDATHDEILMFFETMKREYENASWRDDD